MKKLTKLQILSKIAYEEAEGIHTFTMCKCGRNGCRGSMCNICLREKLYEEKQ